MGFNTTVFILNDRLGEIKDNPVKFVEEVYRAIVGGQRGQWITGQTTVMPTAHADVPRLYYTHGNSIIELCPGYGKDQKEEIQKHPEFYLRAVKWAKKELRDLEREIKPKQ